MLCLRVRRQLWDGRLVMTAAGSAGSWRMTWIQGCRRGRGSKNSIGIDDRVTTFSASKKGKDSCHSNQEFEGMAAILSKRPLPDDTWKPLPVAFYRLSRMISTDPTRPSLMTALTGMHYHRLGPSSSWPSYYRLECRRTGARRGSHMGGRPRFLTNEPP